MMQTHSFEHSNRRLYNTFSARCRLTKNATLSDRRIMSDNINYLTLQQKNIKLRIHIDRHLKNDKLTKSRKNDIWFLQNRRIFSIERSESIENWSVFDKNLIFRYELICCISSNKFVLMLFIWINDVKKTKRRRLTLIVMTIDDCAQYSNQDEKWKNKQRIHVLFMLLKLKSHFYLLHVTNYDIYWLMISCDQYLNDNKELSSKKF
jgi:hypothetical protein